MAEYIDREPILKKWLMRYDAMKQTNIANLHGDEYAVHVAQVTMLAECIRDLSSAHVLENGGKENEIE